MANYFLFETTIAELLFGVANSAPTWQAKRRQEVTDLRDSFTGQELLIGPSLKEFAEVKAHLHQLGRPVDSFDLLIGSTALAHNLTLVAHNPRHFADMPGIVLEDWTIPPAETLATPPARAGGYGGGGGWVRARGLEISLRQSFMVNVS